MVAKAEKPVVAGIQLEDIPNPNANANANPDANPNVNPNPNTLIP